MAAPKNSTAKRTRRGKPVDEKREIALRILVTEEEQELIKAAAKGDERSVSTWVRHAALEKAGAKK